MKTRWTFSNNTGKSKKLSTLNKSATRRSGNGPK